MNTKWTEYEEGYRDGYRRGLEDNQPKKGEWRPVYQGDEIINYRCSECDFGHSFGKNAMNFCPNCGANMRKPYKADTER